MGHFDHVHADVDHWPAALELFSAENAPVGDAAAAQCLAFHEHDVSELAFVASAGDELSGRVKAELKAADQLFLRFLGRLDHLLALGRIHGHWLFGDHVRAGVGCVDVLVDCGGNDTYRGTRWTQGAGCLGVGILADFGGDDIYSSHWCSQGAAMMGIGGALSEAIDFDNGKIMNPRFSRYRVPRFSDMPAIEAVLIDPRDQPSAGAGETPIIGVAPAIGNAIFDAVGVRLRSMPMAPTGIKT